MAESIVTLRVDTRNAVSSLNNASAATNRLSAASKGATKSLAATSTAAKGLGAAIKSSLGPLLAVGTAFGVLNNSVGTFLARERDIAILQQGLTNLGASSAHLETLQEVADKFGKTTLFNQEDFTRGFNLLTSFRNIGVDSYGRVAQAAADIAQVNQVDVSTSFMQLAKALQDPERNLSNLNRSGIAFTKQQTEVIKELMKTNKVAEAHAMILDIVDESYNKLAQAAAEGFAGSVDTLGEEFRDFGETIGRALVPVLDPAVKGITALLGFLNSEGGQATAIIGGIALAAKGLSVVLPLLSTNFIAIKTSALIATGGLTGMNATLMATKAGFANAAVAANVFKVALAKTGIGLAVIAFGAFATEILKVINAQREFNRVVEEGTVAQTNALIQETEEKIVKLQESLKKKNVVTDFFAEMLHGVGSTHMANHEIEILTEKLEKLQNRLKQAGIEESDAKARQSAKLLREENKKLAENLEINKETNELNKLEKEHEMAIAEIIEKHGVVRGQELILLENQNLALKQQQIEQKKIQTEAERIKGLFKEIGDDIATGISDALVDAINGTKSLGEAAKSIVNNLANDLLRLGINTLLKSTGFGIFSNLTGFANGGRPPVGRASVVGEKGPELFVPTTSGTIIPNDQMGGVTNNIVVNVDASGSNVEGDENTGKALGRLIATAVQSELIQQRRPGGLLT